MSSIIRLATPDDAEAILDIYAPIVATTAISFELEPPTLDQMRERIAAKLARYPWLVSVDDGMLTGYAYAGAQSERAAYQWSVQVSLYIHPERRRQGLGRVLYTALFELLRCQGFVNAYAIIALPNPGSVGVHESLGFRLVGVYERIGYKHGAWHSVGWWHLALQEPPTQPQPPLSLAELMRQG